MPALATTTSTGPCSFSTAEKAASTDAASRTSQPTTDSPSTGSPGLEGTGALSPSAARPPPRDRQPDSPVPAGHKHRTCHVYPTSESIKLPAEGTAIGPTARC